MPLDSKQPRAQLLLKVESMEWERERTAWQCNANVCSRLVVYSWLGKGVAVCCSEAWVHTRPDQPCWLA